MYPIFFIILVKMSQDGTGETGHKNNSLFYYKAHLPCIVTTQQDVQQQETTQQIQDDVQINTELLAIAMKVEEEVNLTARKKNLTARMNQPL